MAGGRPKGRRRYKPVTAAPALEDASFVVEAFGRAHFLRVNIMPARADVAGGARRQ